MPTSRAQSMRTLAQEIIAAQEKEIATIDAWFKKKGA
jgi:uncharacterized protein (DUF305 family)